MASYRTLDQLGNVAGQRALVRVDFNVPVDHETGKITDDTRIHGALGTIRYLVGKKARVILMSHRGRPKKPSRHDSLRVVAERLRDLADAPVHFVPDIVGSQAQGAVQQLLPGEVLVLENLRFDPGEKSNDQDFAKALATLGDFYVDDAFGTAHRESASIVGVPALLPSYAGQLLDHELSTLSQILLNPEKPYWIIVGGAKVSDKVGLLGHLLTKADGIVIGGGMANTFLAAAGFNMGASKVEVDAEATAKELLDQAKRCGIPILLPIDLVVTEAFRADAEARVVAVDAVGAREMALDLGPQSIRQIQDRIEGAKTVLWNGPMGVFEWEAFSHATMAVARTLAALSARVVVGGGDSVAAVRRAGVADRLTHVSTGGGATLEFLEGKTLPGVRALAYQCGNELDA